MSPEQIGAVRQIDGRSDIYSLGCVVYEMLVGEPPYGGPSVQVIMARHAAERLPSLTAARSTVPPALQLVVHRAMAKAPADRYRDATRFAAALEQALVAPDRVEPRPRRLSRRGWVAVGAITLALVAGGILASRRHDEPPPVPSRDVVAVVPFELVDAADTSLRRLGEEVTSLVAQRFTGEGGPRALSAGTVQDALARAGGTPGQPLADSRARAIARALGAGVVLMGRVGKDGGRILLNATLESAADGTVLGRVEALNAPRDSLLPVVDRLTAELLSRAAGEPLARLPDLRAERIDVLRTYLAGRLAYIRGQSALAATRFAQAQAADSTFPYPALGLALVRGLEGDVALAYATRNRLSEPDRRYLRALIGVGYPRPTAAVDIVRTWEDAVQNGAGYPESWFKMAEELYHRGPLLGIPGVGERAAAAFRHVLELEPDFVPALGHLIDIAAGSGDTAAVRALTARYFALDSVSDLAGYYRWRRAVSLGDSAARRQIRARMDQLSDATLERIVMAAQLDGTALEDADAAVVARRSQSSLRTATRLAYLHMIEIALTRGHPTQAARLVSERDAATSAGTIDPLMDVVSALFGDGDTVVAAGIVARAAPDLAPKPGTAPTDRALYRVCAAGLWHAERRELPAAAAAAARLDGGVRPAGARAPAGYTQLCAAVIEAESAAAQGRPDAGARLDRLDSLARVDPAVTSWVLTPANLVIARLEEARGRPDAALAAVRRRAYIPDLNEHRILVALPTSLRLEGRLAALTGDTTGARRAYRHYLALRSDPEPALRPQADSVRQALAALGPR
jgi:serine/threonine-protein kinase